MRPQVYPGKNKKTSVCKKKIGTKKSDFLLKKMDLKGDKNDVSEKKQDVNIFFPPRTCRKLGRRKQDVTPRFTRERTFHKIPRRSKFLIFPYFLATGVLPTQEDRTSGGAASQKIRNPKFHKIFETLKK